MSVDRPISLKTIVTTFCAPIKEEHAWAIIFNALKKLTHLHQQDIKCLLVTDVDNIIFNADGDVDDTTFTENVESSSRPEMPNLATGIKSYSLNVCKFRWFGVLILIEWFPPALIFFQNIHLC